MIRQKLPNKPKVGVPIKAKWGREVIEYIRAITPLSDGGKTTTITRLPGGTIIKANAETQIVAVISGGGSNGQYDAVEQVWDESGGSWLDATGGMVWATTPASGEFPALHEINEDTSVAVGTFVMVSKRFHDELQYIWIFDASVGTGTLHFSAALFNDGADKLRVQTGTVYAYFGSVLILEKEITAANKAVWVRVNLINAGNPTVSGTVESGTYPGYFDESLSRINIKLGEITTDAGAFVWTPSHEGDILLGSGRHETLSVRNAADDGTEILHFFDGHFIRTGSGVGDLGEIRYTGLQCWPSRKMG